jgi:copper transport protein
MRLIAGLATLLSVLCFASAASAHASLVSAEPADGSILARTPETVQLRFNESVTPAVVRLIDADGKVRDDASVRAVGETIIISLPENLPRGTQVVSYRVISADSHPVVGSMVFSIGAVTATAVPQVKAGWLDALIWLARIGVYLGLFAGVGGTFFVCWIAPARAGSNAIVAALSLGVLSAAASLGLQGLDVLDLGLGDLATSATWKAALATSLGPSLLIAIAAMAACFVARQSASTGIARTLSALALTAVGVSLAASGHAATAEPQWLTRPMVFLHGVAVAFWVGALVPLVAMTRRPDDALLSALNRFSRLAEAVVAVLVLAGVGLAMVQLQGFGALVATRYGLILSIKLTFVVVLLGLAARNRFSLTPALALDPSKARPLVRSLLLECVAVAGILAAVAGWRFTPPPRALAASVRPPLSIHIHTEKAMFQILVTPGRIGSDSFVLQLMTGDGGPLAAKEATLALSLPARGIEPFERQASPGADGNWSVRDVPLPYSGRWHLRIDALVTDFEKLTLEDDFDLPAR